MTKPKENPAKISKEGPVKKSKLERYVVRKPMIVFNDGTGFKEAIPQIKPPTWSAVNTGPLVPMSPSLVPECTEITEYGFITGDMEQGTITDSIRPHKHDNHDEVFFFIGTDHRNLTDLGGEIEFWLGEGEDLDKVILDTSSAVWVPRGVAHFPQFFRNVKRAIITICVHINTDKRYVERVDPKGRPTFESAGKVKGGDGKHSKWEKYVVRKPMIMFNDGTGVKEAIPQVTPIPVWSPVDTGPLVMMNPTFVPGSPVMIEYGYLSGDLQHGTSTDRIKPHKHDDYDETFFFLGTDPRDVSDLGGEVEFWLGEGEDLTKIVLDSSGAVFMPKGVAHFPLYVRNVKRPIFHMVIMSNIVERKIHRIDPKGRPTYD